MRFGVPYLSILRTVYAKLDRNERDLLSSGKSSEFVLCVNVAVVKGKKTDGVFLPDRAEIPHLILDFRLPILN